ncbi:MAG: hypothetical protein A3F18_00905 [Legionellales bacterium RIFCSPHIGHO2_12_FULL_37_14]|nr:MAG: hypothetical protein A3F18_00905 [Legionellales bacterium RIFCSPHIGHO2_12_FULL_37_14]
MTVFNKFLTISEFYARNMSVSILHQPLVFLSQVNNKYLSLCGDIDFLCLLQLHSQLKVVIPSQIKPEKYHDTLQSTLQLILNLAKKFIESQKLFGSIITI